MTRKSFFRALLAAPLFSASKVQAAPSCTGILGTMSDGSQKAMPLGYGLVIKNGAIQTQLPLQYVDVAAVYSNGVWTYDKPGRNVQVWLNGLLMRKGADYTIDLPSRTITPLTAGWDAGSYVTVAYLY